MQRILVPVDFSPRSANALEFAVAFGSLQKSEIDVLHVWHSDLATGVTVAKERAKSALREFVATLGLRGDVTLRRRVEHGDPYLTIQRVAQLAGHDLIVLAGPEGSRTNEDSVAKSLFFSAPGAVLLVPPNSKARFRSTDDRSFALERVLVPLALAGDELEALDFAEALTSVDPVAIEVLVSSEVSEQRSARLQALPPLARRERHDAAADVVTAVQQRALSSVFDLVVLASQRAPIGGRPDDPRPERVALSQRCPCLCVPA